MPSVIGTTMKNLTFAFLILVTGLISACGANNDYAYNEKITNVFLGQMKEIDETDSVFKDTTKIFAADFADSIILSTKAQNLISNSNIALSDVAALKPGKAAAKFNEGIVQYLKLINDYGLTAKKMLETKPVEEQKKLHAQLMLKYAQLNVYPDRLLEMQKIYLNEVGLQPK